MDVKERLSKADPARGVAQASRAERTALVASLAQRQPSDAAQPARRRSLVAPIAIAAVLAVSMIGFAQPSRAALAWSPTADATPLDSAAALKQVCAEGLPITAEQLDLLSAAPPDLVDTRGNASLVVWSTPALRLHCLLLDDGSGALVRGPVMLSEPLATRRAPSSTPSTSLTTTATLQPGSLPLRLRARSPLSIRRQRCPAAACWILIAHCHLSGMEREASSQRRSRMCGCQPKCGRGHRW